MQPQSPYPPQPNNPYDFIVNPESSGRGSIFGKGSLPQKLLIIGLMLFGLVIIASVAVHLLSGSGDDAYTSLLNVATQQQELIQITGTDADNQPSISANNANVAATTQIAVSTSQQNLLKYLQQNGHKTGAKQLAVGLSSATDQQLTSAASAGTFDSTFTTVMQSALNSYGLALQKAYAQEKGPIGRKLLQGDYQQAQLLLAQLNSPNH